MTFYTWGLYSIQYVKSITFKMHFDGKIVPNFVVKNLQASSSTLLHAPSVLDHCITFWHNKMFSISLALELAISSKALVAFTEKWYLETKCLALAIFIATRVLLLLRFFIFFSHSKDVFLFSHSENPSFQQYIITHLLSPIDTKNSFRIATVTPLSSSLLRKIQALLKFFLSLD